MGFSFYANRFFGVQRSSAAQTDALANGLLVPIETPHKSSAYPYQYKSAIDTNVAVGTVLFQHTFKARVPASWVCNGYVRCKVKWRSNVAGPATSAVAVKLDVKKSGSAIDGLTAYTSSNRDVSVIANYTEDWMVIEIPAGVSFKAGDTIDVIVSFLNQVQVAGATLELYVYMDPSTIADALIVEIDTGVV